MCTLRPTYGLSYIFKYDFIYPVRVKPVHKWGQRAGENDRFPGLPLESMLRQVLIQACPLSRSLKRKDAHWPSGWFMTRAHQDRKKARGTSILFRKQGNPIHIDLPGGNSRSMVLGNFGQPVGHTFDQFSPLQKFSLNWTVMQNPCLISAVIGHLLSMGCRNVLGSVVHYFFSGFSIESHVYKVIKLYRKVLLPLRNLFSGNIN